MHSKMLNMNYNTNNQSSNQVSTLYLNQVQNPSTVISPLSKVNFELNTWYDVTTAALPNYPLANITNDYSMYKEAKMSAGSFVDSFTSTTVYVSGISMNLTGLANTFCYFFNKEDETYTKFLRNSNFYITFRHKSNQSLSRTLKISTLNKTISGRISNNSTDLFNNTNYNSGVDNGFILIDQNILYQLFGQNFISNATYYVDLYIYSQTVPFQISNMFSGYSVDFYADEGLEYTRENLNVYSTNLRNGKVVQQINKYIKKMKINLQNITTAELLTDLKSFLRNNKDSPVCFLPYCEDFIARGVTYAYTTNEANFNLINSEFGGLYYINEDIPITNSTYDVYNLPISMTEYK